MLAQGETTLREAWFDDDNTYSHNVLPCCTCLHAFTRTHCTTTLCALSVLTFYPFYPLMTLACKFSCKKARFVIFCYILDRVDLLYLFWHSFPFRIFIINFYHFTKKKLFNTARFRLIRKFYFTAFNNNFCSRPIFLCWQHPMFAGITSTATILVFFFLDLSFLACCNCCVTVRVLQTAIYI